MAKYLVTGGCGFIGSHLCKFLVEQQHEVVVIDNLDTGKREHLAPGATLIEDTILNTEQMQALFQDIDGCFHLAAIASVERCQKESAYAHQVNQSAFVDMLAMAREGKTPIVFASSAAVYGNCSEDIICETTKPNPISFYAVDKFACELQAAVAHRSFAVPAIGLRFFNVFGLGQDPKSPYSGVISIFSDRIKQGQSLDVYGDGKQTRDFIFVADVVQYLYRSMQRVDQIGFDVFNVCSGKAYTLLELISTLQELHQTQVEIKHHDARFGDVKHSLGSADKIEQAFGYQTQYDLKEGLKTLC